MRRITTLLLVVLICLFMFACEKQKNGNARDYEFSISDDTGIKNAFSIKERKSEYEGKNIEILYIKNNTENEYSITVDGSFLDIAGEIITDSERTKTLFKSSEVCFIFQPEELFDHFEYKITSKKKDSISNGSFSIPSHITLEIVPSPVDIAENREKVTAVLSFGLRMQSDFPNGKWVVGKLIVFDNTGEVFTIKNYEKGTVPGLDIKMMEIKMGNTLWEEGMQVPENLEGQLEIAFDYEYSDNIPSGD